MLSIDNGIFKIVDKLISIIILSVMWFIGSLPIITIGVSTTALYYVSTKQVSDREGYITKDFIKSYKMNFKQGITVFLILFLISGISYTNIVIINKILELRTMWYILFMTQQYIILLECLIVGIYIFPLLARYDLATKELFKTAFFLGHKNIVITLILLILLALLIVISVYSYLVYMMLPSIYIYFSSHFIVYVFRKYNKDFDILD